MLYATQFHQLLNHAIHLNTAQITRETDISTTLISCEGEGTMLKPLTKENVSMLTKQAFPDTLQTTGCVKI